MGARRPVTPSNAVLILDPGLSSGWAATSRLATWATWATFALDYVARLALAQRRAAFVRGHLVDLAVVALPLLGPFAC